MTTEAAFGAGDAHSCYITISFLVFPVLFYPWTFVIVIVILVLFGFLARQTSLIDIDIIYCKRDILSPSSLGRITVLSPALLSIIFSKGSFESHYIHSRTHAMAYIAIQLYEII